MKHSNERGKRTRERIKGDEGLCKHRFEKVYGTRDKPMEIEAVHLRFEEQGVIPKEKGGLCMCSNDQKGCRLVMAHCP